jgi:hypothetical protein
MSLQNSERTAAPSVAATSVPNRPSGAAPARARQPTIPPGGLDELEEAYASRPEGAYSPEEAIDEQISALEDWARTNTRKESRELTRFWLLRGMAFLAAVAAAAGGALHLAELAVVCGGFAALAVAVDAAWPVSSDWIALRRAVHDLRELQHTLKLKWDKVRLAYPDPGSTKRIAHALVLLDSIQAKREEIGKYLGDASPAVSKSVGG